MAQKDKEQIQEYTVYEKARIIGSRALQISMGAPPLIKLSKKEFETLEFNPIRIANKEFESGIIPITIRKNLPKKKEEKKSE